MNKKKRDMQQALIMVFEFGIHMIVPILLCTLIGVWIGNKTNINWMVIPFFFMGALAGYTNVFKMTKRFLKDDKNPKNKGQRDGEIKEGEDHVKKNQ
jgi:F0F1-type ATP synthase assembly protein I